MLLLVDEDGTIPAQDIWLSADSLVSAYNGTRPCASNTKSWTIMAAARRVPGGGAIEGPPIVGGVRTNVVTYVHGVLVDRR